MTTNTTSDESLHWVAAVALTSVAYALAGFASLWWALPPGYASPLFPAAGVALASVLIFGRRMLPAVALGAFCVSLTGGLQEAPFRAEALLLPLVISLGAVLQAFVGAALVTRYAARPLTLSEPRDVLVFLGASAVSCLVGTAVTHLGLLLNRTVTTLDLPFSLATSWFGNLLGVLIAAPIILTWLGRPREAWAPRRVSVGIPLAIAALVLMLGARQIVLAENARVRTEFERDSASAAQALSVQLREPLQALQALHSVVAASDGVTPAEMRLATQAWLAPGTLQAMGWSELVKHDDVPAFETKMRAQGMEHYSVTDRSGFQALPGNTKEVIANRYIEPLANNAAALGENVLSVPAMRAAIDITRRTGQAQATASYRLRQQTAAREGDGVAIFQAVYISRVPAQTERAASLRGAVFVILRPDDQLTALAPLLPPQLSLCLIDASPAQTPRRLAGPAGCETNRAELQHVRALPFAGRLWEVRVTAQRSGLSQAHGAQGWLFALVGSLSSALLGGVLLTMSGRARRVETAVSDRIKALQGEVRERQGVEVTLHESEQRFFNLLNHVPLGVIYTDLRGNVTQTNPRLCELTGYSEEELLTLSVADYTHPEDLGHDVELMAQLMRGELPMYRRHERYVAKHGATVWVRTTVSLLHGANGRPHSIVGVVEDITEHLKLEEAERAREAAEDSNQAKSEFLSRMSHELRTPLNAMLGFAQLLELDQRQPLTPEQQPWVSQIQQAGWHLLDMINDVLDLSRIESGNLRLQTETLNLIDLLDSTVAMVEADAQQRRIEISKDFAPGTATVLGDATRVKQILTNLLSNAVKYNTEDGRIHIACGVLAPDAVEIAVTDTGMGLTPAQLAKLFQPFNRLGRERSSQQGTGIGLVISQRLAELMGGSLRAHSVAGQGSVFILTLPCSSDPDTVRSDLFTSTPEPAEYHRRLVHYVEDNETNVEVMRGILAQRPQVEMQVSVTGADGLAGIRVRRPDLILLDMHLPDISGLELLRHLKADPYSCEIPIVVVSADALSQQIDAAMEAGCTHYLTKPVSVSELLAVLDDLLERVDTQFGS